MPSARDARPSSCGFQETLEHAELIHLALICSSAELLVSPGMSMAYRASASGVSRRVGIAHRNWVVGEGKTVELTSAELDHAAELVACWKTAGYDSKHTALGPLRILSSIAGGSLSAGATVTLLVVALESTLGIDGQSGPIATQLSDATMHQITAYGGPDIGSRLRPLYSQRSNLLHGRSDPVPFDGDIALLVASLVAIVSRRSTLPKPPSSG